MNNLHNDDGGQIGNLYVILFTINMCHKYVGDIPDRYQQCCNVLIHVSCSIWEFDTKIEAITVALKLTRQLNINTVVTEFLIYSIIKNSSHDELLNDIQCYPVLIGNLSNRILTIN